MMMKQKGWVLHPFLGYNARCATSGRAIGDCDMLIDDHLHDAPPVVPRVERGVLGLRADSGGEEQQVRAQQGHAAGGFGKPLWGGGGGVGIMSTWDSTVLLFSIVCVDGVGRRRERLDPWTFHVAWLAGLTHALL